MQRASYNAPNPDAFRQSPRQNDTLGDKARQRSNMKRQKVSESLSPDVDIQLNKMRLSSQQKSPSGSESKFESNNRFGSNNKFGTGNKFGTANKLGGSNSKFGFTPKGYNSEYVNETGDAVIEDDNIFHEEEKNIEDLEIEDE